MKRTNIYLPEQMLKILENESIETGDSVSSIIRNAVSAHQDKDDREGGGYLCLLAMAFAYNQFYGNIGTDFVKGFDSANLMFDQAYNMCIEYNLSADIYTVINGAHERMMRDFMGIVKEENKIKNPSVYLIRNMETGNLKIGFSTNVDERIKILKCGIGADVEIISQKPGTFKDESALQKRFIKDRIFGEWFNDTEEIRKAFNDM